jgi:Spy/CpxP family protein refolding chaperone
MKSMRSVKFGIIAILLALASSAVAQPPPPPFEENGPMRKQIREKIKTMKIWKLTDEVGLTPEQSEKFFPVYNKHQKSLEELDAKRDELVNRLERMTNADQVSDKDISETVRQLEEIPSQIMAERSRFMKEIGSILPLRQQAKLMVFEERFRQRLQEFIRDIRRDANRRRMGD